MQTRLTLFNKWLNVCKASLRDANMTITSRRNNSRANSLLAHAKDFTPVVLAYGFIALGVCAILSAPSSREAIVAFFKTWA